MAQGLEGITAEEYLEKLERFMHSCRVECPLTVLWLASESQKQALNSLCYRFRASRVVLYWSFCLPDNYLEGTLYPSKVAFGISPEGEVHT
jgi:hypothetical protein